MSAIAGGNAHSLALKSDGTVRAWGYNNNGQLGTGRRSQDQAGAGIRVDRGRRIEAGNYHSLAVKSDETLWTWGSTCTARLATARRRLPGRRRCRFRGWPRSP